MAFKVITLNLEAYIQTCLKLQQMVEADGFIPDIVIGIPTGGNRVIENCFDHYTKTSVTLIRPPKGRVKKILKRGLSLLPIALLDKLRIFEAKHLVKRKNHMSSTFIQLPEIAPGTNKILIVDDAVDSGATIKAVKNAFCTKYPNIDIRIAALTVTGINVVANPDYTIYNDMTLIRSPWSVDMK